MSEARFDRLKLLLVAFPELNDAELRDLDHAARVQAYPPGAILCREGDMGHKLFILAEGAGQIYVRADAAQEVLVKEVFAGDYFGEMALLNETARAATVRTEAGCQTLEIDRETFLGIADENPVLLRALVKQISGHLRNSDRSIIHELRKKNEALELAYRDLASQERLRTEFIATLSHELRTPLTSAQGFLHLINKGIMEGAALQTALGSVTRNVEKMVGLINNLLVLYEMHLISPEFAPLRLEDLVDEALAEARESMGDEATTVEVEINWPQHLPELQGDKNGLLLAIRSLIENALKFSPEKTPVVIDITIPTEEQIRLDVIDRGIGIPPEARERIFEPFFRVEGAGANRLFAGLGVGLAIAKFIVERHNGQIQVTSVLGAGSTFTIFLPAVPREAPLPAEKETVEQEAAWPEVLLTEFDP